MKVKDPHFILEKIEKYISEDIRPTRVRRRLLIDSWKYLETSMEDKIDDAYPNDYDDSSWKEFHLWETWGGYDRVAWFRTTVKIPEGFQENGKALALRMIIGPRDGGGSTAEALLYVDGRPVQALDIWHEEAILQPEDHTDNVMHLAVKVWSGVLDIPRVRCFKEAELLELDMKVDRFCLTVDTVRRCALLLDENDLRRIHLTRLLNDTFQRVNFLNYPGAEYYESVYDALAFLENGLAKMAKTEEIKPTVYGVGHSHIDMAWLWRLSATREKASRTFSTVLNLMKQYPEYRFMHSTPQLYQFVKQDYPEIYEQIRKKIADGQWEITGGMWVEADTNIPSGESLVRQFLYGKRFIREEFGKETKLVWLPDVFGYSAALPQIMKKCGMDYFMTTKISWNQYNVFPYDTFWWKGIDGSEIFTHFITTPEDGSWYYTYNGHMDPEEVTGVWKNYKDKDKNENLLIAYGWGDGGGGPTREMIAQSLIMKNIPGIPRVKLSSAEEYFRILYDGCDRERLQTWDGELYFEMHRGTYTSQAANKRFNRKAEYLLHDIEFFYPLADVLGAKTVFPKEQMDIIWERVLLNQFHDIIPGSSIRQVYEDTTADYDKIFSQGKQIKQAALSAMSRRFANAGDSLLVINPTGFVQSDYIELAYQDSITEDCMISDENGMIFCSPSEHSMLIYAENIPAYGYRLYQITRAACNERIEDKSRLSCTITADLTEIETPFYQIKLNENGEIESFYDKKNGRRVDCGRPMNVFRAYEDKPQRFDAWDVDVYYKEKPYHNFVRTDIRVLAQGERLVLRQTWNFNRSVLTQDMILSARNRRIDFVTTIDWKEKQVFLKTYFPVNIHAEEAVYEIQFGNLKRPTHSNTEWDFAKFEVPGHKWADLSEGGYGAAIMNDCKYGYDIQENVIGLSLLKSAVRPDETADRKIHHFTYSFYPHAGSFEEAKVQQEAVALNQPLQATVLEKTKSEKESGQEMNIPSAYGMVSTDCDHIQIDTIKPSEDGTALIVRFFEFGNKKEDVSILFHFGVKAVCECNLCEEEEHPLDLTGMQVVVPVGNYEIKTLKVYPEGV